MCASFYPYIRDIFKKTTKPDVVSWVGWALLTGIAAAAQLSAGASYSVVVPIFATLGNIAVIIVGIKFGYTKFSRLDMFCFGLGLGSVFLWMITADPILAIYLLIVADFIVTIPTIVKTYYKPGTETASAYLLFSFAALLGLLASSNAEPQNVAYPLYIVVENLVIGALALRHRIKKAKVARVR